MGGRGATSRVGSAKLAVSNSFINDLVNNYDDFTRGDLQATIEAQVMSKIGAKDIIKVGKEADKVLQEIDKRYDEKVDVAKQIAKKLGYSQANYKQFLRPQYIEGYAREEGKPYTLAQLKARLKRLK